MSLVAGLLELEAAAHTLDTEFDLEFASCPGFPQAHQVFLRPTPYDTQQKMYIRCGPRSQPLPHWHPGPATASHPRSYSVLRPRFAADSSLHRSVPYHGE